MTFEDYQNDSRRTAQYSVVGHKLVYPTLGLTGEAGEVAEKVKKLLRNNGGKLTPAITEDLTLELGDVLWYLTQLATELGVSLEQVAKANLVKLNDRKIRGVIKSTGDKR